MTDEAFIKLNPKAVKALVGLNSAGRKLWAHIFFSEYKRKDRVFLSFLELEDSKSMSRATFKRGKEELLSKSFIAPTEIRGWYSMNPDFLSVVGQSSSGREDFAAID